MNDAVEGILPEARAAVGAAPPMMDEAPARGRWHAARGRVNLYTRAHLVTGLALAAVLIVGLALRLDNVNWDQGQHLHPDERFLMIVTDSIHAPDSVGQYFDTANSPLNPYQKQSSFVYGTFPLFLNKAVAEWLDKEPNGDTHASADAFRWGMRTFLGVDVRAKGGGFTFNAGYNSQTVGRVLSALFDALTILLVFDLGRVLYRRRVGVMAALFLALTVIHIQHAHFFGSEIFLGLFVTATIYFSVRIWKYGSIWNYLWCGLAFGLALATKLSSLPVIVIPVLAVLMRLWPQFEAIYQGASGRQTPSRTEGDRPFRASAIVVPALRGLLVPITAGVVFRIFQPYAFDGPGFFDVFRWNLDRHDILSVNAVLSLEFLKPVHYFALSAKYRSDIGSLLNQQSGAVDFPPAVQWIDRTKFVFPLSNIFFWGLGIPLSIAAFGGIGIAAWRMIRRLDFTGFLLVFWVVFDFLFIARGFNPTMRYFLPIYPVLAVLAALATVELWDFARSGRAADLMPARPGFLRKLAAPALHVAAGAVVVGAAIWAIAFVGIYRQDISRVQATHWINENVPPGSSVTSVEWDDGLPLNLPGAPNLRLQGIALKPFAADSRQKVDELVRGLDRTDYVIESSNRAYDSIPRFPAHYPNTTLYYKYLFDGTLGFEKVAEFTNYPRLFGIDIPDQGSEEAFTVYDHPKVTIWKKTPQYSHDRAFELLRPELSDAALAAAPKDASQNALQFRPDVLATQKAGGTFSDIFQPGNFVNRHPLFFWLLAMELAAFSLVPLAVAGFRGLPDRGFLLTKPLGVLALSYAAYFPASHGVVQFTRNEIGAGLAFMLVVGIATGALWRDEISAWVRERWRFIVLCEAVFLLAFLAAYWVRLQNPDLWHPFDGGEKPMDLAYFTAVTKTTDMSQGPIDPWNAGGYLNYYYYGQFISATVTKLTGIVPEVAYNLIIPMFFALTAAATFSVTYNLTESTRRLMRRRPGRLTISPKGPVIAALGGIFFVLVAGNLYAVGVLEQELTKQSHWHSSVPVLGGMIAIAGGLKEGIFSGDFRDIVFTYDWWGPSRALSAPPQEVSPITEFPFWTFLFADLHAHLMAMPFAMTFAGVALAVVLNFSRLNPIGAAREHLRSREISSWAMVVVLGLIVGALRWINSWDYPPFLLLGAAALLIAERAKYGGFSLKALGFGVLKIAVMGILSYEFFAPFAKNYSQSYSSVGRSQQTTLLSDYLSHFGIFVFFITGFLVFNLNRTITRTGSVRKIFFGKVHGRKSMQTAPVMIALAVAATLAMWMASMHDYGVVALAAIGLVAVVLISIRELRSGAPTAPVMLFVYAMIALGLGLSGGVELWTLDGDIGRMNTVFKFYLHVWMMWGVVSAFALWYIFGVMQPQAAFLRRASSLNTSLVRVPRFAFAAAALLFLALALVYPYFGTRARIHDRFDGVTSTGNDGFAFLDEANPYVRSSDGSKPGGDYKLAETRDGINWIRENVKGSPTIIEAVGPSYRSMSARVSIYTGLPTVTGWDFHQIQQRAKFGPFVQKRQADVKEFYSTSDPYRAREILRTYDVEWVIVGDEERFDYPVSGLTKFENGLSGYLEKMYENPSMQVWHVIPQDQLPSSASVQAAP